MKSGTKAEFKYVDFLPALLFVAVCYCYKNIDSLSNCLILSFSIWNSFADKTKTPRTRRQRPRKSWRKSARSLRSQEESCRTEWCSAMYEARIHKKAFLFQLIYVPLKTFISSAGSMTTKDAADHLKVISSAIIHNINLVKKYFC